MRRCPGHKIAQLAAVLRIDPPPLPVVWTTPEDRARAAALLPADRPVIALAPTANWLPKIWPADRFVALFHALADGALPGAVPAVFAGPGDAERAMAAPVLAGLPGAMDLVGRLTLPEVSACLARCALFVGNDSGLMHLAAAAGAPTLGLFGPTDAAEYGPSGSRAAAVVAGSSRMEDLSVEQVLAAAVNLARESGRGRDAKRRG
jgi:ADP-heptose:LPS heptosyltransferase